ncbi:Biopterin transport-related protein BT1 [Macleaya cordata]|uniref:Biopterin transport-related protein BT1 n=1 Tax=Macleaya cordata TaxID=56857 RepID=A0A200QC90_MACCD|nr:Biopterin transport-related protein BT1 [Macleaya cordata]
MLILCGFGYWVQGFRCFPWLGLNFNMANTLNLNPSTLQLVQTSANLPMVAKPLYGILSDALYIGGAHRLPYISIGALLQVISWGSLALIPVTGDVLPTLIACMLLGNLGASITEVTQDALIAEYGQKQKVRGLQSYAFMALAAGGIFGNFFGGYFLHKTQHPKIMFLLFALLLSCQFAISLTTREDSFGLPGPSDNYLPRKSILENLCKQFSEMITTISEENIFRPLCWIVGSIVVVPILSGTVFCYQTQCLKLDPSIIGMSKVIGQLMLLVATVLYDRNWKTIPIRKLISRVQIVYATSLLLDLILVKQINLELGISNEAHVLLLSGLAETVAQFKLLPFSVLLANLCPPGCEGSLTSFLASALCLSSILSGFLGVGLASLLGISSGDYSNLTAGIILQFLAALVPLGWISYVPMSELGEKGRKRSKRRLKKVEDEG